MSALRRAITGLAEEFATQVLAALRGASLNELASFGGRGGGALAKRGPGRPPKSASAESAPRGRRGRRRRTAADLAALGVQIVDLVKGKRAGMRSEAIRDALGVAPKELPRVIKQLLADGALKKEGERRATTYYAGKGRVRRVAGPKRGAKKRGRPKKNA